MDAVIIEVYRHLRRLFGCNADRIVCDPELRQRYLSDSRAKLGGGEERALLWRLLCLRKQRKL